MKTKAILGAALGLLLSGPAVGATAEPLPIDAFAMLPVMKQVNVSPDGKHLGVLRARSKAGDYIIEVFDAGDLKSKPVRLGADKMEITGFLWANNKRLLVNFRQKVTQRNVDRWVTRWAVVNSDGKGRWLYLPEPLRVQPGMPPLEIVSLLPDNPDEILISYDLNDNWIDDIARFNVETGRTVTVVRGSEKMSGFSVDSTGEVRGATGFDPATGSIEYYARLKGSEDWKLVKTVKPDAKEREQFAILGFSNARPDEVYVRANRGEDKAGIYTLNIATGDYSERLFGVSSADAGGIILSNKPGRRGDLLGFIYNSDQIKRYLIDGDEEALFNAVKQQFPGKTVGFESRSEDDNLIVVRTLSDKDPGSIYLLRNKTKLDFIGRTFPLLTEDAMPSRSFITYKARDGLEIPAYVTRPAGSGPFPTIVLPHGGPWARDYGSFDEWAALLANHGYLVVQPQYRGSDGFGLALWKAGDAEWGLKMQDDLDDAALDLVKQGLADRNRLGIFGWSYGGYAAFAATERPNNLYKCSVAGAGVSDLSLMNTGLSDNPFLRKFQMPTIKGVSPANHVADANIPILVIHGDIDQRVDIEQSERFVKELKKHGKPYEFIKLEGADHFYDTLTYDHKTKLYTALIDWFDKRCGMK